MTRIGQIGTDLIRADPSNPCHPCSLLERIPNGGRIPMPLFLNVLYLALLFFLAPWFIYKALTTGKYRRGLWRKFTGAVPFIARGMPHVPGFTASVSARYISCGS